MTVSTPALTRTTGESSHSGAYTLALIAVASFAMTLPATKALTGMLSAQQIGLYRAVIAAMAAIPLLWLARAAWPRREQWLSLAIVSGGNIFGFPLLTSVAMQYVPVSHGAVIVAAMPLATALAAAVLSGIRPPRRFWLYACSGTLIVLLYSLWQSGAAGLYVGDLALVGAVLLGAIGYAKGAELSQQMPGWQVISWVVVLSLPVSLPWSVWVYTPGSLSQLPAIGWSALLYIGLVSSLLGFFAWNKALALGGVARISQVQLLQPFLTYGYSIVLLGESWNWLTAIVCALVIGVVWLSKRQP